MQGCHDPGAKVNVGFTGTRKRGIPVYVIRPDGIVVPG